jgi:hypothetical protein
MEAPNTARTMPPRHARAVPLLAAVLALAGCAQRRADAPGEPRAAPEPTNASLASLTADDASPTIQPPPADGFDSTRERILQSAAQLEQMLAGAESASQPPAEPTPEPGGPGAPVGRPGGSAAPLAQAASAEAPPPTPPPAEPAEPTRFSLAAFAGEEDADTSISDLPDDQPPQMTAGPAEPDAAPAAPPTPAPAATDPEQRKQELVDELIGVLGELALDGEGPGSAALALAGLEAVRPQALDALKGQGLLSDAEVASLDAARELFRALSSPGSGVIADPGEVSAVLDRIRRDLDARAGLRITRAELCTRVTGFGRYETFPSNRFIAGRPQPVIVYAEVDRFAHRESTGSDAEPRYEIELSQRLELYHTADNLNTWNRAAETDKTSSRNRVRDYYLINQVTLPPNLSVGKYHLKVVMRDLVAGTMAETIIPIEIVAGGSAR